MGKKYEVFIEDGKVSIRRHKHQRTEGNWINGENLDKIKFPCFCSYRLGKSKRLGQINTDFFKGYTQYTLSNINRQVGNDETTCFVRYDSLERLIEHYDIHILKGKIILFENEKGGET